MAAVYENAEIVLSAMASPSSQGGLDSSALFNSHEKHSRDWSSFGQLALYSRDTRLLSIVEAGYSRSEPWQHPSFTSTMRIIPGNAKLAMVTCPQYSP
jgi:hypothetical protein